MTSTVHPDPLGWLRAAATNDEVHTVRLAWPDRLGTMRGKRLPADLFLDSPRRRIGFCDGMIVVDVNCDVIQETPFSNFETGYPDMYLSPRLETLAPVGWTEGEALVFGDLQDHGGRSLGVSPSNVLASVVSRLEDSGVTAEARFTVSGRLMADRQEPFRLLPDGVGVIEDEPGILRLALLGLDRSGIEVRSLETDRLGGFRLGLGWASPRTAAEQAILVKAALKELARARGLHAVFMTMLPDTPGPARLEADLRLTGADVDAEGVHRRLVAARGLLQPSINAFKAGPVDVLPARRSDGSTLLDGLAASSEADPATVLMTLLAAIGAGSGLEGEPPECESGSLAEAASRLEECWWIRDWAGDEFVENTVPLLRHEASLFEGSVTDWELNRYWSAA